MIIMSNKNNMNLCYKSSGDFLKFFLETNKALQKVTTMG